MAALHRNKEAYMQKKGKGLYKPLAFAFLFVSVYFPYRNHIK